MKMTYRLLVVALAVLFTSLPLSANAAAFTITTNGFADNALLPADMGFDKNDAGGHSCGGVNKAPGWTWSNAPGKTASFAILIVDPGGQAGAGVNHWVEYNIPASATGISTADIAAVKYTNGTGTGDLATYRGPCPAVGDAPHHYDVLLIALDAPPTFAPGLDKDGLVALMKGHVLGVTTTTFRFAR
jgi:Raf kinase inhibitor-like YbhB/YbcL family protein